MCVSLGVRSRRVLPRLAAVYAGVPGECARLVSRQSHLECRTGGAICRYTNPPPPATHPERGHRTAASDSEPSSRRTLMRVASSPAPVKPPSQMPEPPPCATIEITNRPPRVVFPPSPHCKRRRRALPLPPSPRTNHPHVVSFPLQTALSHLGPQPIAALSNLRPSAQQTSTQLRHQPSPVSTFIPPHHHPHVALSSTQRPALNVVIGQLPVRHCGVNLNVCDIVNTDAF